MTTKLTKRDLEDLRDLALEKKELEKRIRDRAEAITSPPGLTALRGSGNTPDPVGVAAAEITDLMVIWREKGHAIDAMVAAVEQLIDGRLRSRDRRIVRMYYFDGYSDVRIARIVHYYPNTVWRHRTRAVAVITEEVNCIESQR